MRLAVYLGSALLVLLSSVVILQGIVRRDYLRKGRLTSFSSASEWLLGLIWASFSYSWLPEEWPLIRIGRILQAVGWTVITGSVLIMLWSLVQLGLRRTHGLETDVLVQTGLYRWTRNPQIIGFCLGMVGFCILWPSWHMLVSYILLVALVHLMVITEEEHLLTRHRDEYEKYCEQVPRYIGRPRQKHQAAT